MRVQVSLAAPFLIYFNHSGFKTFINAEPQFNFLSKSKFSSLNLISPKGYFSLINILPRSFLLIDTLSSIFITPSITSIGNNFFESLFLSLILAVFSCPT